MFSPRGNNLSLGKSITSFMAFEGKCSIFFSFRHVLLTICNGQIHFYLIFFFQYHGPLRFSGPGDWEVCPWILQRDFSLHHVWRASECGSDFEVMHRYFFSSRDRGAGTGGGPLCQINIPVPFARNHDQMDQGENKLTPQATDHKPSSHWNFPKKKRKAQYSPKS